MVGGNVLQPARQATLEAAPRSWHSGCRLAARSV